MPPYMTYLPSNTITQSRKQTVVTSLSQKGRFPPTSVSSFNHQGSSDGRPPCALSAMSAQIQNTATSSVQRRDSVKSWTGSEIFRPSFANNVDVSPQNDNAKSKLSGKAWGRVKKFLLCKTGFPSSIYYIVGNEFCERFSYYGMKAILILYLTRVLALGDNTATAVFHSFSMLCYFTPLFGAMLADGWLGKYR